MSEAMTVEQALRHIGDRLTFPKTGEDFRIVYDAMQSLRTALPREGWKLVPVEPDENMVYAEDDSISPSEARKRRAIIRAAIAATPPAQEEQE